MWPFSRIRPTCTEVHREDTRLITELAIQLKEAKRILKSINATFEGRKVFDNTNGAHTHLLGFVDIDDFFEKYGDENEHK